MMRRLRPVLWSLVALMTASFAVDTCAAADIVKKPIVVDQRDRDYYLYVPDRQTALPPLLVLLHGSGQDGLYMADLWKGTAEREGIVLVAPNALRNDAWRLKEDGPQFIAAVIAAAQSDHPSDPHRVYLFGQSGGAVYALLLGMLESDFFAGVSVHAGAWRHDNEFNAIHYAGRRIPVQIILGDQDEFFPVSAARRTENQLRDAGFPVDLKVIEGQHHWYTADTAPAINDMAVAFLTQQRLAANPVFRLYKEP